MANIRLDLNHAPLDGETITFKAPCDASGITGLIIYYHNEDNTLSSQEFTLNDASGSDIGMLDNIFSEGSIVKVIIDTDTNNAYVQNSDTNMYLESRFSGKAKKEHTHDTIYEINSGLPQQFWRGTKAEYDAIADKDDNVMYIVTDDAGSSGSGGSSVDVSEQINAHNADGEAHADIRQTIENLTAEDVGARAADWMPSAADVGARPDTWIPTAADVGAVPTSSTVNGKALGSDISLSASDVGARPADWMPSAADVGAVPTSRTVNGKALSGNITLSASDVSARPNTWTPSASDVGAVPTSRTVNGKALNGNITLSASDVGAAASSHNHDASNITSGTLAVARGGTGVASLDALATALGAAKIATGSYIGHGDKTSNTVITFPFVPKIAFIYPMTGGGFMGGIVIHGTEKMCTGQASSGRPYAREAIFDGPQLTIVSSSDDSKTYASSVSSIGATIKPWYLRVLQPTMVVLI